MNGRLDEALIFLMSRRAFFSVSEREAVETIVNAIEPLCQAAAHLCAFDWTSLTSPASADLDARILALRAELKR